MLLNLTRALRAEETTDFGAVNGLPRAHTQDRSSIAKEHGKALPTGEGQQTGAGHAVAPPVGKVTQKCDPAGDPRTLLAGCKPGRPGWRTGWSFLKN